ncbi:MAG TPA: SOS response-associated peptidase [Syntrophales bacterium]|jgi:putative SOS response-associated peptidase YedK|nr:SOS response-associated peptidase [Syntrophales bacterium]
MCGRFVLLTDLATLAGDFGFEAPQGLSLPAGEHFPGQEIVAILRDPVLRPALFHWGLVPSWARDPSIGRRLFNARSETAAVKPSFRDAFRHRRCLIPADGFFEWDRTGKPARPVLYGLRSDRPMALAGLYEYRKTAPGDPSAATCTILTTEANDLIRPVHDRMPVILDREGAALWLAPAQTSPSTLQALLAPFPSSGMRILP